MNTALKGMVNLSTVQPFNLSTIFIRDWGLETSMITLSLRERGKTLSETAG
jgi:hypothetical protein